MRTKPVCVRPSRDEEPPSVGGQAVDGAVDAAVVEEDQRAGEPLAGAHEQRLVDRVGVERVAGRPGSPDETRAGAVTGTSRRPTNSQASERTEDHDHEQGDADGQRRDDVLGLLRLAEDRRQPVAAAGRPGTRRTPANTEPTASTIIGTVITGGASCGWTPSSHRGAAEEGHEHQPGHVERGEPGGRGRRCRRARSPSVSPRSNVGLDDRVLGAVARQEREADQRQVAEAEGARR